MGSEDCGSHFEPPIDVFQVGQAFVGWYYYYLLNFPEVIHRFYQKGMNKNTRRIREVKKKIASRDYIGCIAEIEVVDTQESPDGGLQVFVDGHITGKDGVRRRFTQTFFLLRLVENKGYFVYNDIFCYVEDAVQQALPLPDQAKNITLWSSEGREFKVDEEVAWMSETLRDMFEEGCEDDCTTLHGINSGTLNSVLEYCKKHCPANMGDCEEELKQWGKEFVKMEDHHLFEVIVAAKHMKVKGMIDLLCEEAAERVKDLILAKMHRYLDL
ncbi:SKP1-like protein 1B [Acorus calamus]|uniref:SKP1-like protein 1B n=1 Tax=Acorus calamus TaxID=4465 RepID=A0AAV9E6C3_ACOCL|nr:SKP1-like protein 1B [Acorus calamus]